MLELDEVAAVRLQVSIGATSTIIFFKFWDAEVNREYHLWKVAEVPELVGLAVRSRSPILARRASKTAVGDDCAAEAGKAYTVWVARKRSSGSNITPPGVEA